MSLDPHTHTHTHTRVNETQNVLFRFNQVWSESCTDQNQNQIQSLIFLGNELILQSAKCGSGMDPADRSHPRN